MHIIIDPAQVEQLKSKYTVLELDTIRLMPEDRLITAYSVVENIPLNELPLVDSKRSLHENLIINYRKKDWNYCSQALEHLVGSWSGELDTFYDDLSNRIAKYIEQDPGETWDGIIEKRTNS